MEIRSEVSAPARLRPRSVDRKRGVCTPLDFWFGRAGATDEGSGHFFHVCSLHSGSGHGGLCPHPLRKLSFLRTFLLLPPLRTNRRSVLEHRHKPRPSRRCAVVSNFASTRSTNAAVKRRPPARRPRRSLRVSDCVQAQPALLLPPLRTNRRSVLEHRHKPRPSRRCAVVSNFASTRSTNAAVKRRPPARRPRRSLRVSDCVQAQPALLLPPLRTNRRSVLEHRRKPRPSRRSAVASNFASTRSTNAVVKPPPRRRRSRRSPRVSDCVQAQPARWRRRCGR